MLFLAGFTALTGFVVNFRPMICHSLFYVVCVIMSLCDIIAYDLDIDSNVPHYRQGKILWHIVLPTEFSEKCEQLTYAHITI